MTTLSPVSIVATSKELQNRRQTLKAGAQLVSANIGIYMRIAIVGAGAAGLSAAYYLSKKHRVYLFETKQRLGGHAYTYSMPWGPDTGLPLDLGFMVFNEKNYPKTTQLFNELQGISTGQSEMSFSYSCKEKGVYYSINHDSCVEAQISKELLAIIVEIIRFSQKAKVFLKNEDTNSLTLGEFLHKGHFTQAFIERYLLQLTAAIWSMPANSALEFPAKSHLRFFQTHGLLTSTETSSWRYVRGGAYTYVNAITASLGSSIYSDCPVDRIKRTEKGVVIDAGFVRGRFDAVVMATHADDALKLLTEPTDDEKKYLGAWSYQRSDAILHIDNEIMCGPEHNWASWNYNDNLDDNSLSLTYYLNKLQGHESAKQNYFLTINTHQKIKAQHILKTLSFKHPIFTKEALAAQSHLKRLNGNKNTWYCGSYFGYGFHEDAISSGVDVATALGALP